MLNGRLVSLGDSCLSVAFGDRIDPAINLRCVSIAARLARWGRGGVRDIVPTFNAVAVHFDPMEIDRRDLEAELVRLAAAEVPAVTSDVEPIAVPVVYGGEAGPDLIAVAQFGGCSEAEVIRLHASGIYRVYMLGFLPGFAYMASVDTRIAMPRLDTPRLRVPAGSVGIAGTQTGIYPCDTPGGWRIIGRTLMKMFDPDRATPCLLKAGDCVKFVAA